MTTYVYLEGEEIKVLGEGCFIEKGAEMTVSLAGEMAAVTVTTVDLVLLVVDGVGDMVQNVYVEKL